MTRSAISSDPSFKHLILVWAFAESGIGGLLHAFKLPFTGVFIGGIAVVCIALIGYFQNTRKNDILQALTIVLLVKMAVSPHSPWQAYVAVIFQGYLGFWMFRTKGYYKTKTFIFSILCLLESGFQKLLITSLIFGYDFLDSIDIAAKSIVKSWNVAFDSSLVMTIFGIYIILHLLVGIVLGLWIPKIPYQIESMKEKYPNIFRNLHQYNAGPKKNYKPMLWSILGIISLLLTLHFLIPNKPIFELIWFFIRTMGISFLLAFIIGPLIQKMIARKFNSQPIDKSILEQTMVEIPIFTKNAISLIHAVKRNFSGLSRLKYMILGLIIIAMDKTNKHE